MNKQAHSRKANFKSLFTLLRELDAARIRYTIRHSRDDALMIQVNVPGERWEIEFLEDGDIDVEVFQSRGGVTDANGLLDELIRVHGTHPDE